MLPATALEQGFWECDVGGGLWVPYPWPICSLIEQAFCRFKESAEFSERKFDYRVVFCQAGPEDFHRAKQVNAQTGKSREVRRWASKGHKDSLGERDRVQAQAAWSSWLQADWAWVLLDPKTDPLDTQVEAGGVHAAVPVCRQPPAEAYSLGGGVDGHCFTEAFWPDLLRCWPSRDLRCATHPLGRRCNFALRRLSDAEVGGGRGASQAIALEWRGLKDLWGHSGLSGKGSLVAAYRVQNRSLLQGFTTMRQAMLSRLAGENFKDGQGRQGQLSVQMLWHGTKTVSGLVDICGDGFDRAFASTCAYGKGCYFATSAAYSDRYACDVKVPLETRPGLRAMVLAAVIVGETVQGTSGMYPPPVKPHSRTGDRYETACDKAGSPSILVTFRDNQAIPAYVMIYELSS